MKLVCFLAEDVNTGFPQVLKSPGKSWKVLQFENFPRKSWDLLIFMKNPGKVLEFYTIFV